MTSTADPGAGYRGRAKSSRAVGYATSVQSVSNKPHGCRALTLIGSSARSANTPSITETRLRYPSDKTSISPVELGKMPVAKNSLLRLGTLASSCPADEVISTRPLNLTFVTVSQAATDGGARKRQSTALPGTSHNPCRDGVSTYRDWAKLRLSCCPPPSVAFAV